MAPKTQWPVYFNDGYTIDGYVKAVPGLHGELKFRYRPFLVQERDAYFVRMKKADDLEANTVAAAETAKRLVSWQVKHEGQPVAVTPENLLRLPPRMFLRVTNIVLGVEPNDLDATEEASGADDDILKRAEALLRTGTEITNGLQKN